MSPTAKNKIGRGLTLTWRGVALVFFWYLYGYTQDRKTAESNFQHQQDSILRNQQWERWQIESIASVFTNYKVTDYSEHNEFRNNITRLQENVAEINGRFKVRGIQ